MKKQVLGAVALSMGLASSAFAAYNASQSGFIVNVDAGINQSQTTSDTQTINYNNGISIASAQIPAFHSNGGNVSLGVGYQFSFSGENSTHTKFFFGPELTYSVIGNVPINSTALFTLNGQQLSIEKQNSAINDLSINGFVGMYFTPKWYARVSGGFGGFTGASDGMAGTSFNIGLRTGYNLTPHFSIYAQYKAATYLNYAGVLGNMLVSTVTFSNSITPAQAMVQSESIGIQYLF